MKSTIHLSSSFSFLLSILLCMCFCFCCCCSFISFISRALCIRIKNGETENDGRQKQKAFVVGIRAKIFQRYMTSQHKLLISETCHMHTYTHKHIHMSTSSRQTNKQRQNVQKSLSMLNNLHFHMRHKTKLNTTIYRLRLCLFHFILYVLIGVLYGREKTETSSRTKSISHFAMALNAAMCEVTCNFMH